MKLNSELWREIAERGEEGLEARITATMASLAEDRATLQEARREAQEAVQEISRQLSRVDRIFKAAEGTQQQPKKRSKGEEVSITPETEERVLAFLREHPDEPVTVPEVARGAGVSPGTARNAMAVLRSRELVRLIGKRAHAAGSPADEFRLMATATSDGDDS